MNPLTDRPVKDYHCTASYPEGNGFHEKRSFMTNRRKGPLRKHDATKLSAFLRLFQFPMRTSPVSVKIFTGS